MKKQSSMFIRVLASLIGLLLVVSGLPVVPALAAPTGAIEDRDDISVLSVSVNVNTETGMAFTELILNNTGAEDKEIEVTLPEISAGIDLSTLTVKTTEGQEIEAPEGRVTLDIKADGYAGVSYTYKAKKNLVYEGVIGFDLKQLSRQFNDRIGHLEWTVDMPAYEFILVDEIRPLSFTVNGYRICVELYSFQVSRLLNTVYLSRTTHQEMLNTLATEEENLPRYKENAEHAKSRLEEVENKYGIDEYIFEDELEDDVINEYYSAETEYNEAEWKYSKTRSGCFWGRFILEHYREWYRNPEWFKAYWIDAGNPEWTLFNLYYAHMQRTEAQEALVQWYAQNHGAEIYSFVDSHPLYPGMEEVPGYDPWIELLEMPSRLYNYLILITNLSEGYDYWLRDCLAYAAKVQPEQNMYVLVPSAPNIEGTKIRYSSDDEVFLSSANVEMILDQLLNYSGSRYIHLFESDFNDPQVVNDYLDALHVQAVMRALLLQGDDYYVQANGLYSPKQYFGFDEFGDCSFEDFRIKLNEVVGETKLYHYEDPLAEHLSIPVFTQFWGKADSRDENGYLYVYKLNFSSYATDAIDRLMEEKNISAVLMARNAQRQELEDAIKNEIEKTREMLDLPTPEQMGVPVISEEPTEAPVEETTKETTEASTETLTETTAEASTEAVTESSTEELAETSTTAVSSEEETFASKDTRDPSDKGILILLIVIIAGVVGAATAAVVAKKKSKK